MTRILWGAESLKLLELPNREGHPTCRRLGTTWAVTVRTRRATPNCVPVVTVLLRRGSRQTTSFPLAIRQQWWSRNRCRWGSRCIVGTGCSAMSWLRCPFPRRVRNHSRLVSTRRRGWCHERLDVGLYTGPAYYEVQVQQRQTVRWCRDESRANWCRELVLHHCCGCRHRRWRVVFRTLLRCRRSRNDRLDGWFTRSRWTIACGLGLSNVSERTLELSLNDLHWYRKLHVIQAHRTWRHNGSTHWFFISFGCDADISGDVVGQRTQISSPSPSFQNDKALSALAATTRFASSKDILIFSARKYFLAASQAPVVAPKISARRCSCGTYGWYSARYLSSCVSV